MSLNPPQVRAAALMRDRRSGLDRRHRDALRYLFSRKKRRHSPGRRETDAAGYVDIYDSRTWTVAIAVLSLSLLDAVLTGLQVRGGLATEANPVLRAALARGGWYMFFCVKAALTAFPLAIIILHKNWSLGRYAARLCLWSYALVALYHFYLVLAIHS